MALRLSNINELNKLFQAVADAVREALQSLRKNLELLSLYVGKIEPEAAISFSPVHETIINQLEEIARIAGSSCIAEGEDRGSTFTGSVITSYQGSLFIVAPAGFGKTSFCAGMLSTTLRNCSTEEAALCRSTYRCIKSLILRRGASRRPSSSMPEFPLFFLSMGERITTAPEFIWMAWMRYRAPQHRNASASLQQRPQNTIRASR